MAVERSSTVGRLGICQEENKLRVIGRREDAQGGRRGVCGLTEEPCLRNYNSPACGPGMREKGKGGLPS